MATLPKTTKKYCPHCKTHTEHKIQQKKNRGHNQTHPLSHGSRKRMQRRGLDRGTGNQGRTSRGAPSSWKRSNQKTSKKVDIRYVCTVCGKSQVLKNTYRAKKLEIK